MRFFTATCLLFLVFVCFLTCTRKSEKVSASVAAVLKYSESGAATNMDPTQATTLYESLVMRNIFDTLYAYKYLKRPFELMPLLAEALPQISEDGLTYTIKLKKGVFYIDDPCFADALGREVVAGDFVYAIKRHFDPVNRSANVWLWRDRVVGLDEWKEKGADYSAKIEGLKALDSHTIQLKLKKPYFQLLYVLAMASSSLIPREAVEKYGREFSVKPVGSGPYRLESIDNQRAVLVRNTKFRDEVFDPVKEGYDQALHGFTGILELKGRKVPVTDRVEVHFFSDFDARWNSFTKGNEIQFSSIPIKQVDNVLLSKNPVKLKPEYDTKYRHMTYEEFGLVFHLFNMDDPRIGYHKDPRQAERNKALRCALRKATNWEQRIERFYNGIGEAFPGILLPGIDGYDPNLSRDSVKFDPEGAKKLLADNGWNAKNLPVFDYGVVASVLATQFYEQFRGWVKAIGYPSEKVKYRSYATFGDFAKAMKERRVMYMGYAWNIDYPDSENLLSLFYGPNASPGANVSNYDNPKYDELYMQAMALPPGEKRTELYRKMNQMLIDDCVAITGFSRTGVYLWHDNVLMYPGRGELGGIFLRYAGVK